MHIILQGVRLASLAHSLFMNFETVVSTGWRAGIDCKMAGWRAGIDCKRAGWRSGQGRVTCVDLAPIKSS